MILAAYVCLPLCTACDSSETQNDVILQRSDLQAESVKLRGIYRCAYRQAIIATITLDFLYAL